MNALARLAALLLPMLLAAQAHAAMGGGAAEPLPTDDIPDAQRAGIWQAIDANRSRLKLVRTKAAPAVTFQWPLRAARGYDGAGFHILANFVDHEAAAPSQLRDYACGARSYDLASGYNHRGTDISISPDGWNLMMAGQVEVVAAAPGVIVHRRDGHDDRNCRFSSAPWNAVYVQHADGSIAWYGHLKKGSVTTKAVGAPVVAGERLGLVGSSGSSSGPHLHFEVYDADGKLIDPFAGSCNATTPASWWAAQPAYHDAALLRNFTATAPRKLATCGDDGVMSDPGNWFEKRAFAPGDTVYFVSTFRDLLSGQPSQQRVLRPDGSVWREWTL